MNNYSVGQRLQRQLKSLIDSTPPGEKLPSEPVLANELGVSRATLREAMRTFEIQGRIRRRQGSGTFVTQPSQVLESGLEILESIPKIADRIGLKVTLGKWRAIRRKPDSQEANLLNISELENVTDVTRVMLTEGRPAAFLIDVLPEDILIPERIDRRFNGSILDTLIIRTELELIASRTEINAVTATPEIARALGIQRGDALLCFQANLLSASGRIVDISTSYFLPGYFKFHVVRRIE